MTSPTVLVLDDGVAGHQIQAMALAAALNLGRVAQARFSLRQPYQALSPRWWPVRFRALSEASVEPSSLSDDDIVVACGRRSAVAAQALRCRVPSLRLVQILDPGDDLTRYDAVVLPAHDRRHCKGAIRTRLALHDLYPSPLASAPSTIPAAKPECQVFLVGAPSAAVPWSPDALLARLERARQETSLKSSVSRRTPDALRRMLAQWHQRHQLSFHDPQTQDPDRNPYRQWLADATQLVVTADSVSMVSEAAATWAQLECFGREHARGKMARFYRILLATGRLSEHSFQPLFELPEVAQRVRERLIAGA